MKHRFASRMGNVQKSFIREILKVTQNPDVISFAGGLPNPHYFHPKGPRFPADERTKRYSPSILSKIYPTQFDACIEERPP